MNREKLKRLVQQEANMAQQQPYEFRVSQDYPDVREEEFEQEVATVEIVLLELTDDYVQIDISASSSGCSAFFPVGQVVVIRKHP